MLRHCTMLILALAAVTLRAAEARPLRAVARAPLPDGYIDGAFALDERGSLAYAFTDPKGTVILRIGPPGKRGRDVDIGSFTAAPERVLAVGGAWAVIADDGKRKAAIVGPDGIRGQVGPFAECLVHGRGLVTMAERDDRSGGGRLVEIAMHGPDGRRQFGKTMAIGADGALAGMQGVSLVAFTGDFLQALVRKPGGYDRRTDARGLPELATMDLRTGRIGPGKRLTNMDEYARIVGRREDGPGLEAFVRVEGNGLELVGPGDRVRPLALPERRIPYDLATLRQQRVGGQIVVSLVVDPLAGPSPTERSGARLLQVFTVEVGSGRLAARGETPLDDGQSASSAFWVAGAGRIALVRRNTERGREIVVYALG